MLISPIMSANIPFIDEYINGIFTPEEKAEIEGAFLEFEFNKMWGTDYRCLNKHTINADKWNPAAYWETVRGTKDPRRGVHPLRASKKAHNLLNKFSLNHLDDIFGKKDLSLSERNPVYFTNTFFATRTEIWKEANDRKELFDSVFDECRLNELRIELGLPILAIENGYAMHLGFNNVRKLGEEQLLYSKLLKELTEI